MGAALAAALAVAALAASAAAAQRSASNTVQEGRAGAYSWSASAGGGDRGAVCLVVAIRHRLGRFAYDRTKFRRCAVGLKARREPLVAGGTELSGRKGSMTVLAMAVAGGVDRLRLTFADGSQTTVSPRPISPKAAGPGLRGLRYAVVALPAHRCLTGLVSEAGGRVVWTGNGDRCLPDWSQLANLGELSSAPHE